MSLHEFDIIKHYFTAQSQQASVVKSVGDDCAIVSVDADKQLVMSMDTIVLGRHFPSSASAYQIGTRALCTSLSDLAAMGAKPLWFTLGLTLPSVGQQWLADFSKGLFYIAQQFDIDLIGGDTTQGPLTITVQVHGEVEAGTALMRDAAQADDVVFVTGNVGDGAAALQLVVDPIDNSRQQECSADAQAYLIERFYSPIPQLVAGQHILPFAHSAIDLSDGLLADAQHIAQMSGVDIVINVDCLPVSSHLLHYEPECYRNWALSGGDDYQLLFTVSKNRCSEIERLIENNIIDATEIGFVREGSGGVLTQLDNMPFHFSNNKGYQHFAS